MKKEKEAELKIELIGKKKSESINQQDRKN